MRQNQIQKFSQMLAVLAEIHNKNLTKTLIKAYFTALLPFKFEKVEGAISRSINELKFFPKPAELIEFIQGDPNESKADVAEIQATVVLRAIATYGSYQSPTFEDPITADIVTKRFGWGHLCSYITDDTKPWFMKEFKEAYLSFSRSMGNNVIEFKPGENIKKLVSKIG